MNNLIGLIQIARLFSLLLDAGTTLFMLINQQVQPV